MNSTLQVEHFVLFLASMMLDLTDSMGAYRSDEGFDRNFGEAIVEIRSIKSISVSALQKMGVSDRISRKFLTGEESPLQDHAFALLSLLEQLFQ